MSLLIRTRWLILADLDAVLAIERASFPHPWTWGEFLNALRQPQGCGMVAQRGDAILGYMVYALALNGIVLWNLAVAPQYRRQGIGMGLLQVLRAKCQRGVIEAAVAERNLPAQLFLRACGYRATRVLRRYFHAVDPPEDAYLMEYSSFRPQNRIAGHLPRPADSGIVQ